MFRLSILEQSIAVAGRPQAESIRNAVALARHCDALGYERFWVSEHHSHPTIVGTAPEILVAAIAGATEAIRVGSAGVMLPHYSPLKVAEQFRVLDALAPGRIDLGLGRAPGSDGRTAFALHPLADRRAERFPADVRDLLAWVGGEPLPEDHPFRAVRAYPEGETVPEVWILGSSDYGAQVAAAFGLPYCFAWFFTDGRGCAEALDLYRRTYRPSPRRPEPHDGICVWALAADTEEEAEYHFRPRARWQLLRDRGIYGALESPEDSAAQAADGDGARRLARLRDRAMIGAPDEAAAKIRAVADELGVREVAVVTWAHDEAARRRSYALLARAFGLAPRRPPAPGGGGPR